jgi:surfeit locus 1 family protein
VSGLSRTTGRPPLSYRWALRPGWILSHLFVLVCVVLFVRLGFWQLARLGERRAHNTLIETRQQTPAAPLGQVVSPTAGPDEVEAAVYRSVTATGTYRADQQVLVRNESFRGAPGSWVVTPLLLPDGRAVAVNRGWVPAAAADGDPAAYAPPAGTVTVIGLVARTEEREGLGAADPAEGRLHDLARLDVARLGKQVDEPLYPVYVTLQGQQPAVGQIPVPVPPGVLDDGPHLNYAGQWFIFATLTCVVYPLLLRRQARSKAAEAAGGDDEAAEPVLPGVG